MSDALNNFIPDPMADALDALDVEGACGMAQGFTDRLTAEADSAELLSEDELAQRSKPYQDGYRR